MSKVYSNKEKLVSQLGLVVENWSISSVLEMTIAYAHTEGISAEDIYESWTVNDMMNYLYDRYTDGLMLADDSHILELTRIAGEMGILNKERN